MTDLTRDQKALKSLTSHLIDECGGPTACAVILNVRSASLVSAYGNPDDPNPTPRFMPLDKIAALEAKAGKSIIGTWLVEKLRQEAPRARRNLSSDDVCRFAKEVGEAMAAKAQALQGASRRADGRVCVADRALTVKELRDVIDLCFELIDCLEAGE